MDDIKRNKILSHIDKIEQQARRPGNEWLLLDLMRRFGSEKVKQIEEYLALDYTIDEIAIGIDYSFVKDDILRIKLNSDWREMLRYRCGVGQHGVNFGVFCKFAHFQAEGMVNYYHYQRKMSNECDIEWFNKNIQAYNDKCKTEARDGKEPFKLKPVSEKDLSKIGYQTKLSVFLNCLEDAARLMPQERRRLSYELGVIKRVKDNILRRDVSSENVPSKEIMKAFSNVEKTLLSLNCEVKQAIKLKI